MTDNVVSFGFPDSRQPREIFTFSLIVLVRDMKSLGLLKRLEMGSHAKKAWISDIGSGMLHTHCSSLRQPYHHPTVCFPTRP